MEKPVRRKGSKGSFMRAFDVPSTNSYDALPEAKENQEPKMKGSESTAQQKSTKRASTSGPRTYHIPATIATQNGAIITDRRVRDSTIEQPVNDSASGDVDLNLSFDFVSTMEDAMASGNEDSYASLDALASDGDMQSTSPSKQGHSQTPRGMSKADWGSRSRKKPPTPLSLGAKRAKESPAPPNEQVSVFSPDTAMIDLRNEYDDQPLSVVPLSATRRGAQANAHNDKDSMMLLISEQRTAAAQRQTADSKSRQSSPTKKLSRGEAIERLSNKKIGMPKKAALGENKAMNNAQVGRNVEELQDEVFFASNTHAGKDRDFKAEKRDSVASFLPSSLGHDGAQHSQHQRLRSARSRQASVQESMDSNHSIPQSFKTVETSKTSTNGHEANSNVSHDGHPTYAPSPSAENVLGLLFPARHVNDLPVIKTIASSPVMEQQGSQDHADMASSEVGQSSSPTTPFSPLFSPTTDVRKGGSASTAGGRTPQTAISTLFEDVVDDSSPKEQPDVLRHTTVPISQPRAIAAEVIREESTLSLASPAKSAVKAQDGHVIAHDSSQPPLRSSLEDERSMDGSEQSAVEGNVTQTMIINTASGAEDGKPSFDLTHITGTNVHQGPWPESPLLLQSHREDTASKSIGLGLFMGPLGDNGIDEQAHRQVDPVVVQRSMIEPFGELSQDNVQHGTNILQKSSGLSVRETSLERRTSAKLTRPATSTSITDGFAINVTPPAPTYSPALSQPDHRVDVPSNVFNEGEREELMDDRAQGSDNRRWSSRLWSMTTAFRSPALIGAFSDSANKTNSASSPPMRALTLVSKQETDKRRQSMTINDIALRSPLAVSNGDTPDGYHTAPSTGALPSRSQFEKQDNRALESINRPQAAMYSESRLSRQLQRPASRIRYVNEVAGDDYIQVDMDPTKEAAGSKAMFDDVKSPRVAASPSGMTPRMEFLSQAKVQRRSWTSSGHGFEAAAVASGASSTVHGVSPWLAPKRQSLTGARDSELYNLANTVQELLRHTENSDEDAVAVEAILGDEGLRRRMNHRSVNSVPNTPTFVPEAWSKQEGPNTDGDEVQAQATIHDSDPSKRGMSVVFDESDSTHSNGERSGDGRRSRLSIYRRPKSGMGAMLSGRRPMYLPSTMEEERTHPSSATPYLHLHARRPSTMPIHRSSRRMSGLLRHDGDQDGLLAYSGKALQNANASKTLFFAGFLFMPWLWFIGGWAMDEDGLVHIEHEKGFGIWTSKESRTSDSDNERETLGSAQASTGDHRSPYLSQSDDEDQKEDTYARSAWSRMSRGSMNWKDGLRMRRKHGGMGGEAQRRNDEALSKRPAPEEEWPMIRAARNAFDWRKLDMYVVANRVMALVACVVIFCGTGVAIAAVVMHWH